MPNTGALGSPQQPAPSPLTGTTAGLLTGGNPLLGYIAGGAGPSVAGPNLSAALGQQQLGMSGVNAGVGAAELQSGLGFDLSNALLGYQGIGLQSQGLAAQAGTSAQQQGLEEAQYGVQSGQYPEEAQKAALSNALAVSGQQDTGAITGTINTQGYKRQQAAQGAEYGWQQADIFRQQQLADLGQQSEEAGYAGQQEQIANQRQQLELAAQGQGISTQQLIAQFGFGLNQLGVQSTPEQYLSTIAGAQGQSAQALSAAGSQAALIGGLGANATSYLGGG
jgi:hypothetical protein